jgi:hypothetical protein
MKISLVPLEHASTAWNQARHWLEPAIERCNGRWTMEHLCAAVMMGNTQLWVAFDDDKVWGAVTTEVTRYPARTMLSMHFLGGERFDDWYVDMLKNLSRYAKDVGCDGLEGVARFGFWKWLKQDDFVKSSVFYEKDLTDE